MEGMKRSFSIIILLLWSCSHDSSISKDLNFSIEGYQKVLIEEGVTASNAIILFKDGEEVVKSIVNSNIDGDMDIDDNTIFPIWSLSKTITGIGVMILYERGLIDFKDPLSKYIPYFDNLECKDENSEKIYYCDNEITLLDLMTHRSGYPQNNEYYPARDNKYTNLDDFVRDVAKHPVEFEPGSDYLYGASYDILGRVIEVVSNQPFYEFLKENIFELIGMNSTKFYIDENERNNFQILFRRNNDLSEFTFEYDQNEYLPEGNGHFGGSGLVSTIPDLMKFCEMLLSRGSYKNKKIISSESIDMMTTTYTKSSYKNGFYDGWDIGFSLFILNEPLFDGSNAPKGIYRFAGYHNNHFWIDYKNNLYGLLMARSIPHSKEMVHKLRSIVYNIIN